MKITFFITILFSLIVSCKPGQISVTFNSSKERPLITSVEVKNDQVIISGENLKEVHQVRVSGASTHSFQIESKSANQLVLNPRSAFNFLVGETYEFFIANAHGSSTFPISFELQNGQVTSAKLHHMGATPGQILKFNGTSWLPVDAANSQMYAGTYNASTDSPDIETLGGTSGTFYIVNQAGTQDLGNGPLTFSVGDWVIFNGSDWERVALGSNAVSSFNGRMGAIIPLADDYTWSMLGKTSGKLTDSKLDEIADIDVTGIQDGDVLKWDQTNSIWVSAPDEGGSIAAGSVTSTELSNGSVTSAKIADGSIVDADISASAGIAQSKILNLTTALSGKESLISTAATTTYFRGDKSWATLDTSNVPENGRLYFLDSRVRGALLAGYAVGANQALAASDSLIEALGKLEAQILATRDSVTDSSYWAQTGSSVHYTGGNIGIGTMSPAHRLEVVGNTYLNGSSLILGTGEGATPSALTLRGPAAAGSNITGANFNIDASNGTGSGGSGNIQLRTAGPNSNAVQFDAITSAQLSGTSVNFNHTTGTGANRVLVVSVGISMSATVSSVTYGGQALTLLHQSSAGSPRLSVWYMVAPPSGLNSVVINKSASGDNQAQAITYSNVNPSLPIDGLQTASNIATSSALLVSSAVNEVVLGISYSYTGITPAGDLVEVAESEQYGEYLNTSSALGKASVASTFNYSSSDAFRHVAFSLNPVSGDSLVSNNLQTRLTVTNAGNVGIGLTSPSHRLDVSGNIRSSGCLYYSGGSVGACASDKRLKENVAPFQLGLNELLGIDPVYFTYNGLGGFEKSSELQLGVIAQDVEKTAPGLIVKKRLRLRPEDRFETEIKAVDYGAFTYLIINSVKDLYRLLQGLSENSSQVNEEIVKLKQDNQELQRENQRVKAYLCQQDPQAPFCP